MYGIKETSDRYVYQRRVELGSKVIASTLSRSALVVSLENNNAKILVFTSNTPDPSLL